MANQNLEPVLSIGEAAPLFTLLDLEGATHRLVSHGGQIVLVNFWSAECPWSARTDRAIQPLLDVWGPAIVLLTVASNANEPVELLRRVAADRGLPRVLLDVNQEVADRYGARTTPHLFAIDAQGILRYQGAFDNVTFRRRTPTRFYVQMAVEDLLAGRSPDPAQTAPYGCTIVRHTS